MTADVHVSELTPVSFLERSAYVFRDRVAVVDDDRRFTWAETRERTRRLAVALQEWGLRHGERVAFLAPNVPELLEAHFGLPWAGGVLVAINTRLHPDEIDYILRHSGSRVLVVDESLRELVPEPPVERVLVCRESGDGDYDEFLDGAGDGDPEWRLESELDTISINYTSGTTGRPKGVMYTHRGAYLNALATVAHGRLDPSSTFLWTLPMFHCNGWCFTWASRLRVAVTCVCGRSTHRWSGSCWSASASRTSTAHRRCSSCSLRIRLRVDWSSRSGSRLAARRLHRR
jgi:fatty-acyl-CoA synthase